MNFIAALLHANIGYGIRRKVWNKNAILELEGFQLRWINRATNVIQGCNLHGVGGHTATDLNTEDISSTDWEVI